MCAHKIYIHPRDRISPSEIVKPKLIVRDA